MEAKKNVKRLSDKINHHIDRLETAIKGSNLRLAEKHSNDIKEPLDKSLEILIDFEMQDIDLNEPWFTDAKKLKESGQATLIKVEDFILEYEDRESEKAIERVSETRLDKLISDINTFRDDLRTPVCKIIEDVDDSKQANVIDKEIHEKKDMLTQFNKSQSEICSSVKTGSLSVKIKMLHELYVSVNVMLNEWVRAARKLYPSEACVSTSSESLRSDRGPKLNLERLSLPVFKGNIRGFARFIKEFESTVGLQFQDPETKVLYLKNQCLIVPLYSLWKG